MRSLTSRHDGHALRRHGGDLAHAAWPRRRESESAGIAEGRRGRREVVARGCAFKLADCWTSRPFISDIVLPKELQREVVVAVLVVEEEEEEEEEEASIEVAAHSDAHSLEAPLTQHLFQAFSSNLH